MATTIERLEARLAAERAKAAEKIVKKLAASYKAEDASLAAVEKASARIEVEQAKQRDLIEEAEALRLDPNDVIAEAHALNRETAEDN